MTYCLDYGIMVFKMDDLGTKAPCLCYSGPSVSGPNENRLNLSFIPHIEVDEIIVFVLRLLLLNFVSLERQ
jgi:hypothetical protein